MNCVCANFPAVVSFMEGRSGNLTFPIEAFILEKNFDSFSSISLRFPMYNLKKRHIKRPAHNCKALNNLFEDHPYAR